MLWGVVPCHLARDPSRFRWCKTLIQARGRVRLEVIDDQDHLLGFWVVLVDQETELLRKCNACLAFGHPHFPPTGERLHPQKETGGAMALILIILPRWPSGLMGERTPGGAMQFLARFVQAD